MRRHHSNIHMNDLYESHGLIKLYSCVNHSQSMEDGRITSEQVDPGQGKT